MTSPTTSSQELLEQARQWMALDPDEDTRAELERLVSDAAGDADALAALQERFSGTLQFGTAGLRAEVGAGPMRMNRLVVRRAAAGIAAYLLEKAEGRYVPRAVVGYDARTKSDLFALDTAAVFTAAGIETHVMPTVAPTPLLAYAVRQLHAEAGVMVTASHNPPADNGYKVYLGGRAVADSGQGAQIVTPMDAEIAAHIAAVKDVAVAERGWNVLGGDITRSYLEQTLKLSSVDPKAAASLKIVYTAMHGVGSPLLTAVLAGAGFTQVVPVAAQDEPDPAFPTVAFPNPEEPGALDLALEAARAHGADLVIANDPDADRCAVAVPDAQGSWRMLRGDEVGALLGQYLAGRMAGRKTDGVFANSIVSSRLLGRIARAHGLEHRETLTGFKWISRVPDLVFGYEEALGYCVDPEHVRDKDGISAALLLANMAAEQKAAGRTLPDLLDDLAVQHGLHASDQLSLRVADLSLIQELMDQLRRQPPASLGGSPVVAHHDLLHPENGLPPTDGLMFLTANDTRVIVRPSGTEPKLKCYLEAWIPVSTTQDAGLPLDQARDEAFSRLDKVRTELAHVLGR